MNLKYKCFNKWTRGIFHLLFDHSNGIWHNQCFILHDANKNTHETSIRKQAIGLLYQLKTDRFCLLCTLRDLSQRTKSHLLTEMLSNVLNWINSVSVALDRQAENTILGLEYIRQWLN